MVTGREDLADRVRSLRSYGVEAPLVYERVGGNHRLDEVQAAVLRVKLAHLDEANRRRSAHAAAYDAALEALGFVRPVRPPAPASHAFHQYVVRLPDADGFRRDRVRARLLELGVETKVYYPTPLHRQPSISGRALHDELPVAEAASRETLALPVRPSLTLEERAWVVEALADAVLDTPVAVGG